MLGLIGAGNMARALARGWAEPVLASDSGSGRAAALVAEVGGEALPSAEVARRADVVLLCHKPSQLEAVARECAAGTDGTLVISVLAPCALEELRAAYPAARVARALPNTPVEVRRGVTVLAEGGAVEEARALLERVGRVHVVPEDRMEAAMATMGVAPAYAALVVEAQVDAAIKRGLPAPLASALAVEALEGSAALIAARGGDTLAVRRAVTSPGGTTARGLAALEAAGLRAAFEAAAGAVTGR